MRYIFILALFAVGCGQVTDPRKNHGIDKEFSSYVKTYEDLKGRKIGDIPMNFGKMSNGNVGQCIVYKGSVNNFGQVKNYKFKEILIDKEYWDNASEGHRWTLIFHELGHCDLNRGHVEGYDDYYRPKSIMLPENFNIFFYDGKFQNYLINELFRTNKNYKNLEKNTSCVNEVVID